RLRSHAPGVGRPFHVSPTCAFPATLCPGSPPHWLCPFATPLLTSPKSCASPAGNHPEARPVAARKRLWSNVNNKNYKGWKGKASAWKSSCIWTLTCDCKVS
ncbi:hypothetical protein H1C71_028377, partial [Ictidomys tridecemlineatus]